MGHGLFLKARTGFALLVSAALVQLCEGQLSNNREWKENLHRGYVVERDVAYAQQDSLSNRLDVYIPISADGPRPVLMWFHGGGWRNGSKDSVSSQLLPYLRMGWTVVNVEYRLTRVAKAPAAVLDCRCALHWVYANAARIKADVSRIVVSGSSAGGHLALMTGMLPAGSVLEASCPEPAVGSVAAIVNFYGITDVPQLLSGADEKGYAVAWLEVGPEREKVAEAVSPMRYVRRGLPPVLTIHGNSDPTVPYGQAVALHAALDSLQVPNRLMTIKGGGHGRFGSEQNKQIEREIVEFLLAHKIFEEEK